METVKSISLFFKEGNSDKEYFVQIVKSDDKFSVEFQYGRVGNSLTEGTKTPTPVSEAEANKIFDKLVKEKTKKGYKEKQPTKGDC
jgi:bifunctional non-homologous end joining protein LigD